MTNLKTRVRLSDIQVVQYSAETLTLSGTTNFNGILQSKGIEIDGTVTDSVNEIGYVLKFDGTKIKLSPDLSGGTTNTFNNGIIKNGIDVGLGGSLTGNTTIDLSSYDLTFSNGQLYVDGFFIENIEFITSGSTHNQVLVYNSGTTRYEPSFIDYNTLINKPVTGGKASKLNKKMAVIAGATDGMLVCNESISGTTSPNSYVTVFLDGIEFSVGGTGSTFYFSSEYQPLGTPSTWREAGEEQKGDYCYANPSKIPFNEITSDMEISFHYLTTD